MRASGWYFVSPATSSHLKRIPKMTPDQKPAKKEQLVKVFEAATLTEAAVVCSLLDGAGIFSPDFESAEPFALHEPPQGWHDSEVWVPESQAAEARRVIEDARRNGASSEATAC
jgi:hypothetical protein